MKKIRTKNSRIINKNTLLVTVDIGKTTNMGYYRTPDGIEIKPFEFFNNGRGFHKLWQCIFKAKNIHNLKEVVVGFESTGPYAEPLIHYLRTRGIKLVQVNPMHTKRVKELQGNSPNKTDRKDPKVIADIIELGHALTLVVPYGTAAELRRLTHARERRIGMRTELLNQLHALISVLFPELLQVIKSIKSKSVQYILKHYPTPQDIAALDLEDLILILKKISRGKVGEEKVKALHEAAKSSVGIKEGQTSIVFEIANILSIIEMSNSFISKVEEKIANYLKQIPYSRFILSIKGIGEVTAAGLIGEAGDFRKFKTISEIHKLAGLDLFEISSGQHKGQRRISKRGRPLIRKLLYFAALRVVRKGGILHEQYISYLQRGMLRKKALVAIFRKLLSIIFALIRDHSEYVIDYTKLQTSALKKAA